MNLRHSKSITHFIYIKLIIGIFLFWSLVSSVYADQLTFTLMTYDSMLGQDSLGKIIETEFSEQCQCKIKWMSVPDSGQLISRLNLQKSRSQGAELPDVILGIDDSLWPQFKDWAMPQEIKKGQFSFVSQIDQTPNRIHEGRMPLDWGVLSLIVNTKAAKEASISLPSSYWDLTQEAWKKKWTLEDPRTSTPGWMFFAGSQKALGTRWEEYVRSIKQTWLNLAPGWSQAYGLMTSGEAIAAWSYVSSQAYHQKKGQNEYKAVFFKEGNPIQIESFLFLKEKIKDDKKKTLVKKFIKFMYSKKIQEALFGTQWMFPVTSDAVWPDLFLNLPKPIGLIVPDLETDWMSRWQNLIK